MKLLGNGLDRGGEIGRDGHLDFIGLRHGEA
jgi:hypothetical protein